jgi:rhodanese-related sulfurtransferase
MNLLKSLFSSPPSLNVSDLKAKLAGKDTPILIDVRQPNEFRQSHVKGAKLIPLQELHQRMDELPRDREIVCICRSGARSGSAVRQLNNSGFNSFNVQGGMIAWNRAGFPTKKGQR